MSDARVRSTRAGPCQPLGWVCDAREIDSATNAELAQAGVTRGQRQIVPVLRAQLTMLAALIVAVSVASLLVYFAKSVLLREPVHSPESSAFGSTSGLSFDEYRKHQQQLLRNRKQADTNQEDKSAEGSSEQKPVMQPPKSDLAPPKDDPFTVEQLKQYDGTDPSKPIYVAIKGALLFLLTLQHWLTY